MTISRTTAGGLRPTRFEGNVCSLAAFRGQLCLEGSLLRHWDTRQYGEPQLRPKWLGISCMALHFPFWKISSSHIGICRPTHNGTLITLPRNVHITLTYSLVSTEGGAYDMSARRHCVCCPNNFRPDWRVLITLAMNITQLQGTPPLYA